MAHLKIAYEKGPTLEESYFVGVEEENGKPTDKEPVVVRATHILHPALVSSIKRIAASEATDAEKQKELDTVAVQPEKYVEYLTQACSTLDDFYHLSLRIADLHQKAGEKVQVTAAGDKAPTYATEPQDKIKVGDKATVAAEEPLTPDKAVSLEGAPDIKKYFSQLPTKAVGNPELAIDVNSHVLAEALQMERVKNASLQAELDRKAKEENVGEALDILTEMGVIEDPKDREKYSKDLADLDEVALGKVEKLLKDIKSAVGKEDKKPAGGPPKAPAGGLGGPGGPGGPKPPTPPKGGEDKLPGGMPALSSVGNVFQGSLVEENVPAVQNFAQNFGADANALSAFWQQENRSKVPGIRN